MDFSIGELDNFYNENITIHEAYDNWTTAANNTHNDDDDFKIYLENNKKNFMYKVAILLIKIFFPSLVVLGTVANSLVIVVLRQGTINTDNLNFFFSVLAVVDTVFLYTRLFLNQLSFTLSAWMMLVIAWQRWYTCSRPFDRCCPVENSKCGYAGLACICLILVAANSYVLVTVELHEDPWGKICAPSQKHDRIVSEVFPIVLMVLYSGLPAILLIVLNSLLARILYTSRRSLLTHSESSQPNGRDDRQVRARYKNVTVLLMALSVSWFLLTTPHTLLKMIEHVPHTPYDAGTHTFLNVLFFVLLYINHSINFFLYCALIRSFRREVRKLGSRMIRCAMAPIHCFQRRTLKHNGHHFGISNSSINNINNHNCNTDSFVPLLELHSVFHPQEVNQHGYKPDYHIT
ncbi:unnamed protein product [Candidula unifasciata]|uniref:G-protein coupled receptors family 1 profile domain-containing protein n=1 Tax=Candidula unifasciata TaxID=100452 RepID=A0A8S3ZC13_9EUPU|nr:unnamed protein product [Candidula unifasciata]